MAMFCAFIRYKFVKFTSSLKIKPWFFAYMYLMIYTSFTNDLVMISLTFKTVS